MPFLLIHSWLRSLCTSLVWTDVIPSGTRTQQPCPDWCIVSEGELPILPTPGAHVVPGTGGSQGMFVESMKNNHHSSLPQYFCPWYIQIDLSRGKWKVMLCLGKHESGPVRFSSKAPWCIFQGRVPWDCDSGTWCFPWMARQHGVPLGTCVSVFFPEAWCHYFLFFPFIPDPLYSFFIWSYGFYIYVNIKISAI